jgi:Xaa-Pro aminopeptidase
VTGTHPHFEPAEFSARMAKIGAALAKARVSVGLFDEIEAMAWLTGYGNSENRWRCVGIPVEGEPFWLIRALDAGPCRERSAVGDITSYLDWEDPSAALAALLAERGLAESVIGVEYGSPSMTARRLEELKAALPRARFVDLGTLVAEARLVKSAAEIALLRRAAAIADEALRRAASACRPGGSQRDAALAASAAFIELGADPGAPGPITAGRGWDFLHGHMSETPLAEGDVVHIELTPRLMGYTARIMRCVAVGRPAAELARAAELLAKLQDRQIEAMRPGALASEVDAVLRQGVTEAKLRPDFQNITGYTLGYYSHATTHTSDFTRIFHPKAEWRLEPGMVFHMYVSAAGASFSETVLVGENGPECLTKTPRTILEGGA